MGLKINHLCLICGIKFMHDVTQPLFCEDCRPDAGLMAINSLKHIADDHECCRADLLECIKVFETLAEERDITK